MIYTVMTECSIPESSILYASRYFGSTVVVQVAVIILLAHCWASTTRADLPHWYFDEPYLTTITYPSWIAEAISLSEASLDWYGDSR